MMTIIYKRKRSTSNLPMYLQTEYAFAMIERDEMTERDLYKNYSLMSKPMSTKDNKIEITIEAEKTEQVRYFDNAWRTEEEIAICKAEHKQQRRSYNDRVSFNGFTSNAKITEAINEYYANCCY